MLLLMFYDVCTSTVLYSNTRFRTFSYGNTSSRKVPEDNQLGHWTRVSAWMDIKVDDVANKNSKHSRN